MRENTKWIMLVTALAFVGLMVFEWGMDITGRSTGFAGELGRVNGSPVGYDAYMATYRLLYDQAQTSQTEPITTEQNAQLEEMAWNQLVTQILIQQELARRGIEVTDDEIRQAAFVSPPPEFMSNELFQTDGRFDLTKYQQYLSSRSFDQELLLQLEAYYRDVIPRSKLLRQVTQGVYVSDAELWERWRDTNERVSVRYVAFPPDRLVPDSTVSLTEGEIEAYYDTHREDFATPATATVKIAAVTRGASAADTASARARALEIRQEILGGADFGEVARRESADSASAAAGGDLGTVRRGQMLLGLDEAVFNTPIGRLSEPALSTLGFHIVRVNRRTGDEATARHILIRIETGEETELAELTLADSLDVLTRRNTLDEAAAALSLPVRTIDITRDFPFAAGVGRVGEGAVWAFEDAIPGDISPVFETALAYYALELVSVEPAGYLPLTEAEPTIRAVLMSQKKLDRLAQMAATVVDQTRQGKSLEQAAQEAGLSVQTAGPFARGDFVPDLGRLNAAIGAAFGLDVNQISSPVRTEANVVVLQVVAKTPADSAAWETQKESQRGQLMALARDQRLDEWVAALRESARIVDRREEVLRPDTTSLPLQQGPQ
ncbi:MAG: SurA N-terminal domain-containing protein [Gemmatimonadetes bacterium]|nr:SurA N-terminal domain-containing protein [Gemmatimonadota bacterium]